MDSDDSPLLSEYSHNDPVSRFHRHDNLIAGQGTYG